MAVNIKSSWIIRHVLTAGSLLVALALAWGAMSTDVENIKEEQRDVSQAINEINERLRKMEVENATVAAKIDGQGETLDRILDKLDRIDNNR